MPLCSSLGVASRWKQAYVWVSAAAAERQTWVLQGRQLAQGEAQPPVNPNRSLRKSWIGGGALRVRACLLPVLSGAVGNSALEDGGIRAASICWTMPVGFTSMATIIHPSEGPGIFTQGASPSTPVLEVQDGAKWHSV